MNCKFFDLNVLKISFIDKLGFLILQFITNVSKQIYNIILTFDFTMFFMSPNYLNMSKKQIKKIKRRPMSNNKFLARPTYQGNDNKPTKIELIQYDRNNYKTQEVSIDAKLKSLIDNSKINWFKIVGMSDVDNISKICVDMGLHGFDIRDLLSPQQITKVVTYDNVDFILMHGFYFNQDEILEDTQIAFLLGENFVVSIQESENPLFDSITESIQENNAQLHDKSVDYLLYILMTAINAQIVNTVIKIEDLLSDVEENLISQNNQVDIMHYLRTCRLYYTYMKRAVLALREELRNILDNTNKLIAEENIIYFNNYDDKLRATLGNLEGLLESINSLFEIYYNNNNLKMNNIMKQLTIVSTIFIPLTFLVGVWGMNFDNMPETKWKYGYLFAWIILVVILLLVLMILKKKKWF